MFDTTSSWPPLLGLLLLSVPLLYGIVTVLSTGRHAATPAIQWTIARTAAAIAFAISLGLAIALPLVGDGVFRALTLVPLGNVGDLSLSVRLDTLTAVMLVLVSFIGLVILQYSRAYLDGDSAQSQYVRWFMATLAAVTLLVIANNLLLLALAWMGTSLALHQLLTHFRDRPQALIAAHKKFLISRVADLCLLGAVVLIGGTFGTLEMDHVFAGMADLAQPQATMTVATVLLAGGAALKCAQLPFHGWLIQVMEAPTPVSALLHAGIVNIGGFLMIRLAPVMGAAELAQTLLVIAGTTTAVVAALVMTTRVSIKVHLAWSTCAQMGFMLVQCGLGAYPLALLHLVAHSLYKAHSFLSAGSVVEQWRARQMAPATRRASLGAWFAAAAIAPLAVVAAGAAFGVDPQAEPALWALAAIVALALTPLLARTATGGGTRVAALIAGSLGVAVLYFGWHAVFSGLLEGHGQEAAASTTRLAIVFVGFGLLFVLQSILSARPHGTLARRLHPPLFAGLYLDEIFTRITFRVWPARLPAPTDARSIPLHNLEA